MFIKPGQSEGACTPVGPDCGGALLQLDPPVASSHWILVRGQVVLPQQPAVRSGWWPLRQSPVTRIGGGDLTLTLRLPEDDEPRPLQLAIDGSFEARLAAYLPRLRDSRRLVRFSLNYRNSHIEQSVPLFMPKPHAGLAIVVLLPALSVRQGLDPDGKQVPMLSEVSRDLTTVLHGGEMDQIGRAHV